jgi:hypothetical protein
MDELNELKQQVNSLVWDKHNLLRRFERKEVTEEVFNTMLKGIQSKIDIINSNLMNIFNSKQKEDEVKKNKLEENKMAGEAKPEEQKKVGKKPKQDSYTMLIVKALMRKDIKNMEALVQRVDEQKPGRDKKKIEGQAKSIIYLVKNKESPKVAKRWQSYNWSDENFLLTEIQ